MPIPLLQFLVVAAAFAGAMVTTALTIAMVTATLTVAMIAAALTISVAATTATATALFCTTAGGQFSTCSGIRFHVIGIVTQLADLLTQLVGIGSGRIVSDGQLGGLHVVGVVLHSLEIGHVLFELVCTFLTYAIGLDGDSLLLLGGFLGVCAQGDDGC